MITDFIRTQEKNFQKAFALAQELNLPQLKTLVSRSADQLYFVESTSASKTPRELVENACHYFNRLYHTLAPNFNSIENCTLLGSPTSQAFEGSSSASPSSTDDFNLSIASASSRSTPESLDPHEIISNPPAYGLVPIPISQRTYMPESRPSPSVRPTPEKYNSELSESRFAFQVPVGSGAPIPIPVPSTGKAADLPENPITPSRLSNSFQGLQINSCRSLNMPFPSISPTSSCPMLPSECSRNTSKKRKRQRDCTVTTNDQTIITHHHHSKNLQRDQKSNARKLELEMIMRKAKALCHPQVGEVTTLEPQNVRDSDINTRTVDNVENQWMVGTQKIDARTQFRKRDSRQQRNGSSIQVHRCWLQTELRCVLSTMSSQFSEYNLTSCSDKLQIIEPKVQMLVDKANLGQVQFHDFKMIYELATQITRLCKLRIRLLTAVISKKSSQLSKKRPRWSLQSRHRLETDPRSILKEWFTANSECPYPDYAEKLELAAMSGLTVPAVTKWFINARSRTPCKP